MSDRLFYVLLPRFNMFSLTNLMEPARIANYLSVEDVYHKKYLSFDRPDIMASNGMAVKCEMAPEQIRRNDLIFIVGSWGAEHYTNRKLFSWLRLQARNGVRICAVEMGAYVLARAGLLARRSATTHWSYLAGFLGPSCGSLGHLEASWRHLMRDCPTKRWLHASMASKIPFFMHFCYNFLSTSTSRTM